MKLVVMLVCGLAFAAVSAFGGDSVGSGGTKNPDKVPGNPSTPQLPPTMPKPSR